MKCRRIRERLLAMLYGVMYLKLAWTISNDICMSFVVSLK
jgi:hypothetical protein